MSEVKSGIYMFQDLAEDVQQQVIERNRHRLEHLTSDEEIREHLIQIVSAYFKDGSLY
jgi:hypothetical protein